MLTIVNNNPLIMIANDDPSLTIVNIIVNSFFQKQSYKKTVANPFNKTIVFKNDRYSFSKSSKRAFLKTIVFFRKRNDPF